MTKNSSEKTCWIVGAGEFCAPLFTPFEGDYVIAADGGYAELQKLGVRIDMVLGDFDSLGHRPQHENLKIFTPVKDDTDMTLAAKEGLKLGFRRFILTGGTGGRLAHTIANLQTLMYLSKCGAQAFLCGRTETATALTDGEMIFSNLYSGYLSLFCLSEKAEGVTLRGLKYQLTDGSLESSIPLGVSNEFTGEPATVRVKSGTIILLWKTQNLPLPQRK